MRELEHAWACERVLWREQPEAEPVALDSAAACAANLGCSVQAVRSACDARRSDIAAPLRERVRAGCGAACAFPPRRSEERSV